VPKWGCFSPTWKREESNHKWGGREGPGRENRHRGGAVSGGWGGTWYSIWWGKKTEALPASRKNGNRQPWEIGDWRDPPEIWEVIDSKDSKGGTLYEIPDSREKEPIEPTSCMKSGQEVRDGVSIPQSQLWAIFVPVWKNYTDRNGEEPEEEKLYWQGQSGIQLKGRSQGLTLLLRLWSTHKKGPSMTALRKTQETAERVRCKYLHPTNGQKLLTPVVELGKSWKKSCGGGWPCRKNNSLNEHGPPRSLRHWITNQAAHTHWYEAPNTYTAEDCLVWVQSEKMHLTLKRL
jgi:hypothetical protein